MCVREAIRGAQIHVMKEVETSDDIEVLKRKAVAVSIAASPSRTPQTFATFEEKQEEQTKPNKPRIHFCQAELI